MSLSYWERKFLKAKEDYEYYRDLARMDPDDDFAVRKALEYAEEMVRAAKELRELEEEDRGTLAPSFLREVRACSI